MRGRLFVLAGPSGSGKSSIARRLLEEANLEFSVSATTRAPRPAEQDGVHYRFIVDDEFERLIDQNALLEWARYNNHYYGTLLDPVDEAVEAGRDVLLEIELQGARQIRESRPDAIMFFIAPPDMAELERRLRSRGDTTESDIQQRLLIAEREMAEAPGLFDHIVVNDDLDGAVSEIRGLITG